MKKPSVAFGSFVLLGDKRRNPTQSRRKLRRDRVG
jgi:hypothetical protein